MPSDRLLCDPIVLIFCTAYKGVTLIICAKYEQYQCWWRVRQGNSPIWLETIQETIQLCYRGQFTSHYKQEEQQLQNIISSHIAPQENRTNIKLNIYYKNKKLRHLILRANSNGKSDMYW